MNAVTRPMRRDAVANQERVLAAAVTSTPRDGRHVPMSVIAAEAGVGTGLEQLSRWLDEDIREHDQLVLPLHGGPVPLSRAAQAAHQRQHRALTRILETGRTDGSIRDDVQLGDVIFFGAVLVERIHGQRHWRRIATRHD